MANLQGADLSDANLQGATLFNSRISNCILEGAHVFASRNFPSLATCIGSVNSKAIQKGYDEHGETEYDFSKPEIWNKIINNLKSKIPEGELKVEAIQRVEDARKDALSSKVSALGDDTIQETDTEKIKEFKEARRTLACTNKWIAYGIRQQNREGKRKPSIWYDEGFNNYLRENCQEIAEFVFRPEASDTGRYSKD